MSQKELNEKITEKYLELSITDDIDKRLEIIYQIQNYEDRLYNLIKNNRKNESEEIQDDTIGNTL